MPTWPTQCSATDGLLAGAVLVGLVLNAGLGWWSADLAARFVIVYQAVRGAQMIFDRRH